jgi:hypothetical protein
MAEGIGGGAPRAVARNIEEVVRLEREAIRRRPPSSRVADHVAGFADPYPFGLLGMLFSLEGVLLAAFVLMKQNRMSALAEQRSHLDLQISLLAEQEVTKIIQMLEHVSARLGIEREAVDAEAREMGEITAVGGLAHRLREQLPDDT